MFNFIRRFFGAARDTAEAVAKPEVARVTVTETAVEPAKQAKPRKRAVKPRKTSR